MDCYIVARWQWRNVQMIGDVAYLNLPNAVAAAKTARSLDGTDCMYAIHQACSKDYSVNWDQYVTQV